MEEKLGMDVKKTSKVNEGVGKRTEAVSKGSCCVCVGEAKDGA